MKVKEPPIAGPTRSTGSNGPVARIKRRSRPTCRPKDMDSESANTFGG